ncbi:MAG: acyltransferase [Planctomycetota bacterium]
MSWARLLRHPIRFTREKLDIAKRRKDPVELLRYRGAVVGRNVFIDKNVEIEQRASFLLEIGDGVGIGENCRIILHDSSTWSHCDLPTKFGKVVLRDRVYVGVSSIILCGVEVGAGTVIGAGSLVTKSLPAGVVAAGVPCKVLDTIENYSARMREVYEADDDPLVYWVKPVTRDTIRELRDRVERERREGAVPERFAESDAISRAAAVPSSHS